MNNRTNFPDMRPATPPVVRDLPPLAQYRRTVPAFKSIDPDAATPRVGRRRYALWFGVAIGLHAVLLLALWLSPPLRLKWGPSADAWVQVTSLPQEQAKVPAADPGPPVPVLKSVPSKPKNHRTPPAVDNGSSSDLR